MTSRTPIEFPCPRCRAREGEPCWTLTDGAMRTTPHDARRRKAGEHLERPEQTRKQIDAREAGARHWAIAGALGHLRSVAACRLVVGFDADDRGDLAAAVEALSRIDGRRRGRKEMRDALDGIAKNESATALGHNDPDSVVDVGGL